MTDINGRNMSGDAGYWYGTFADAYKDILNAVMWSSGTTPPVGLRKERTCEVNDLTWKIPLTDSGLFTNDAHPSGGTDLRYLAGELLWYFSGRDDNHWIREYSSFWDKIKIHPESTAPIHHSAYGRLLFAPIQRYDGKSVTNEYQWCLAELLKDPASRRAVITLNRPIHHYVGNPDVVCTLNIGFMVRDGHLDMRVNMRSSDVWYGLPFDIPFFLLLGRQFLQHLNDARDQEGIEGLILPGDYIHHAWSTHAYERDWDKIHALLARETRSMQMPDLGEQLIHAGGEPSRFVTEAMAFINQAMGFLGCESPAPSVVPGGLHEWVLRHASKPRATLKKPKKVTTQ